MVKMDEGRSECFQNFNINLHERDLSEGLGVVGKDNISMDLKEIGINMIENVLKWSTDSDTNLTVVCRHRWSR